MAEALDLNKLSQDLNNAGSPWEMDENTSLAQMTEDERVRRLGFTPPPGELSIADAVKADEAKMAITASQIEAESISLPRKFDNRDHNGKDFTTPVKNQGGCGSCVAFGSAAVLETTLKRSRNNPNLAIDLSEAHLFYCHGKDDGRNCGNGWWPNKALEYAKSKGVTLEEYFPYTSGDQACAVKSGGSDNLARSTGMTKLNGRADIKKWLVERGSTTGCFIVYQDFFSYKSGVYRHVSGNSVGGHCVEIIGYDDAQGCWICKNSWGEGWGDKGYFRIAYGEAQIDSWAGPYGVNGVTLRRWNRNVAVSGLWSNQSARNAYVYLSGVGWRRLATTSDLTHAGMLTELAAAKAAQRRVNALEDNNQIRELYVL